MSETSASAHPAEEVLAGYEDGVLEPEERAAVQAHVEGCAVCQKTLEDLALVRQVMRTLPFVEPPAGFYERTLRLGPRPRRSSSKRLGYGLLATLAVLAATLALVAVIGHRSGEVHPAVGAAVEQLLRPSPRAVPNMLAEPAGGLPTSLAGFQFVQVVEAGGRTHDLYADGGRGLDVTWDEGRLDLDPRPPGAQLLSVEGQPGWVAVERGLGQLAVQRGERVYAVIGALDVDGALDVATALPAASASRSIVDRAESAGHALLEAFGGDG